MLLLLKMLTLSFSISRYFFCKSTAFFHLPQSKGYGDIDFLMEFYAKDSNTTYLYTIFHIQTYFCTYIKLKYALHSIPQKAHPLYKRRHATNRVKFFLYHLFRDQQSGRLLFCKHNLSFTSATTKKDFISTIS